jgi:hypothetical protein
MLELIIRNWAGRFSSIIVRFTVDSAFVDILGNLFHEYQ